MLSLFSLWNYITFTDVLVAVSAILIAAFFMNKFNKRRLTMPGPFPWPIIGNIMALGANPQEAFRELGRRYGGIYQLKLGGISVVVLTKYDVIREALTRKKTTFSGRPLFQSFRNISFGQGIAFNSHTTQGEDWMKNKTITLKHLHTFVTSVNTRARFADHIRKEMVELIKEITKQAEMTPDGFVNAGEMLTVAVANVICALVYGKRYDHDNEEFRELFSLNILFGDVIGSGSQVDTMPWIKIFPFYKKSIATFNMATERMNNWNLQRTKEHYATYMQGDMKDIADGLTYTFNRNGESEEGERLVAALSNDIFGATQDTMSAAMQWIMLYLIKYPEHQKKVREEVVNFMTDNETYPSIPPHTSLPIVEAFIHEIMRHSSIVASTIPHCTLTDTELRGHEIPEGTVVFVSQYSVNHDPDVWDEPQEFKPERFLDENGNIDRKVVDQCLIFSLGNRKCPGKDLAILWMRYFLVLFVHLCEVEQDPKQPASLQSSGNLSRHPKLRLKLKVLKPEVLRKMSEEEGPGTKKSSVECNGSALSSGNEEARYVTKKTSNNTNEMQGKSFDNNNLNTCKLCTFPLGP